MALTGNTASDGIAQAIMVGLWGGGGEWHQHVTGLSRGLHYHGRYVRWILITMGGGQRDSGVGYRMVRSHTRVQTEYRALILRIDWTSWFMTVFNIFAIFFYNGSSRISVKITKSCERP
jgi:hypothetical protein